MPRILKNIFKSPALHNFTSIHHRHSIGNLRNNAEVVSDVVLQKK